LLTHGAKARYTRCICHYHGFDRDAPDAMTVILSGDGHLSCAPLYSVYLGLM